MTVEEINKQSDEQNAAMVFTGWGPTDCVINVPRA